MLDASRCRDRLEAARRFARQRGLSERLEEQLAYLRDYGEGDGHPWKGRIAVRLFDDSAPHSFLVHWVLDPDTDEEKVWMNGGLIYYGRGDTGVSAPQFSVRLTGTDEGWQVHT